ncbi:7901_t:CDS:2 [Paraglomus brasilianum]|uniref:7901_t:CDS:1 n=1 Tax=Paraglomus brasilianum TaxID=144538 RepID=A0A9N9ANI0_9GLOM|nr:7901_t:CDS:2 [Paraglomus brasilianum]
MSSMHHYHPLQNHYVLTQIFKYLTEQRVLYSCVQVSSHWYASAAPFLYRRPIPKKLHKFINTIADAAQHRTLLPYNLMVCEWILADKPNALFMSQCCSNVRYICFSKHVFIDESLTEKLLKNWRRLRSIVLQKNATDETLSLIAQHSQSIESIEIHGCLVTDNGIRTLLSHCHAINSITIVKCPSITDKTLNALSSAPCTSILQTLNINECQFTDSGFAAVSLFPTLHRLSLQALKINSGLLHLAKSVPQLEELTFRNMPKLTDNVVATFGKTCRELKRLKLYQCKEINGVGVKECKTIVELSYFAANMEFGELEGICDGCRKIEKLTIDAKLHDVGNDEDIICAISQLKELKALGLYSGSLISPLDKLKLQKECPNLQKIN